MATQPGRGWNLPGLSAAAQRVNESSNIRVFSSKGLSAPGVLGSFPLPQIGTPIPGTIYVYVKPRLSQDEGLGVGGGGSQFPFQPFEFPGGGKIAGARAVGAPGPSHVTITNPQYNFFRRYQRSASIGMGAAGQRGRDMDVPFQSDAPWYAHP